MGRLLCRVTGPGDEELRPTEEGAVERWLRFGTLLPSIWSGISFQRGGDFVNNPQMSTEQLLALLITLGPIRC